MCAPSSVRQASGIGEGKLTDWAQCSALVGLKFGMAKRFADNWEVAGAAGVAISLVHAEDKVNKSEVFIDAELNHPAHPVYFLGEGRLFFDHIDDVSNNYQFWGGVRVHF
jgi:hypothetical protein